MLPPKSLKRNALIASLGNTDYTNISEQADQTEVVARLYQNVP